ncbi:MAG: hypothetical protein GY862_00935 [Gammaproteobacteria bacterium]|nr:hypothetical protein [Gammaproteobacteria bacterium]
MSYNIDNNSQDPGEYNYCSFHAWCAGAGYCSSKYSGSCGVEWPLVINDGEHVFGVWPYSARYSATWVTGTGFTKPVLIKQDGTTESLTPDGNDLTPINIDPGNAVIAKRIYIGRLSVSETYIVVQAASGELFQKTPTGFIPWDGRLVDNAYSADAEGILDFPVASGDLSGLPLPTFPLTIYVGFKDDSGGLYYGSFQVTAVFD